MPSTGRRALPIGLKRAPTVETFDALEGALSLSNAHKFTAGGVFIIAEAGVNHNGDEAQALRLVEAAVRCGADAIKFQTFRADRLVHSSAPTAEYQRSKTGEDRQHAMLSRLELSLPTHRLLAERCQQLGIEFMSTPFDEGSADDLIAMGVRRIKVPSGEITNLPFLRHLARARVPLIISTGMATLAEVDEAVVAVANEWQRTGSPRASRDLVLLHCTSNYPAAPETVNLRAMETLARHFGIPVGYSDHTDGLLAATSAVAMGACVIEKHFTLSKALPGPDHQASLEPDDLAEMVRNIRLVEQMLGSGEKQPMASELAIRDLVRRSIVVRLPLAAGAVIHETDIHLLRPGTGIAPRNLPQVLGRRTRSAIAAGQLLAWEDLE